MKNFYLMLFPLLYWGPICDVKLAWNLCVCVGLGLPIGNILKNVFCIRRPSSPPVWQVNTATEEHEFALPSTHALLASAVSIHIALYHITNYQQYEWTLLIGWFLFVILWTTSISLSRVYMGAHTFQDIVLGGIVGTIFGLTLSIILEILHDLLVAQSSSVVILSALFAIIIIHCHPINKDNRLNFYLSEGTFDYTSPLVGLTLGSILSRSHYLFVYNQCINGWNSKLLVRFGVGLPISISCYILVRKLLPKILEPIFRTLRIRAHYIPYSDYIKYITSCIKHFSEDIPNGVLLHHEDGTNGANGANGTNGKHFQYQYQQNPELLLAWVRIYTKFFLYLVLTYTVVVGVPHICEWILEKK